MTQDIERLRLERDIAAKTAGNLMEELRQIKNQSAQLAEQQKQLQEAREMIRELVHLIVRPLVGGKNKHPMVDVGRLVKANQSLLDSAVAQIRLMTAN